MDFRWSTLSLLLAVAVVGLALTLATAVFPAAVLEAAGATIAGATAADATTAGDHVVVIDPGHNGANGTHIKEINRLVDAGGFLKACNTTGTTSLSGMTEAAFNWSVASKLGVILVADGWTVVYTRQDNHGWGPCVDQRGLTAAKVGAVALLSIHGDGGPSSGHGFHVIWPGPVANYTASTSKSSLRLATAVRDALVKSGASPSTYTGRRGLDGRTDLGTLNRSSVPSMMVEAGNLRNVGDDRELSTDAGQQRVAAAVAKGFEAWAGSTG